MPLQATRHVLIHFRGLHMLHNLSILLTDRLIKLSHVDFDDNQTEVYVYGLECLLNTTITVNILIIWGLISLTLTKTYSAHQHILFRASLGITLFHLLCIS